MALDTKTTITPTENGVSWQVELVPPKKEPRKVSMASVICGLCEMPGSLDERGRCSHCRVKPRAADVARAEKRERIEAARV